MRSLLFSLVAACASATLCAQPITGVWYGTLSVQKKLHLVFHIAKTNSGYATTMDSPDQGASGLKTDTTTYENNTLIIVKKGLGMTYTASFDSATATFKGTFQQGPAQLPLNLSRTKDDTKPEVRPQDPVDFPYTQEEVVIKNTKDSVFLAGTLTSPKDKKASKIVILISGSGPQNRNEELAPFNHRPFLVLSDWLTRHGIAVLRYDDRGTASSSGNFAKSTTADFADDAEAAVEYIRSRKDLDGMEIGLVGHSEGGVIAPMVAVRNKKVAFVVMLAGPGVPSDVLMLKQTEVSQVAEKVSREVIDLNLAVEKKAYNYLIQHPKDTRKQVEPEVKKIFIADLEKYPAADMKGSSPEEIAERDTKTMITPWFRYFITIEPESYLTKLKCPVLAMNGTLDVQVDAGMNLVAIEAALKKAKNKHYEIAPMAGLNHLFQKAETGNVDEYGKIAETMNVAAMQKISDWINNL